MHDDWQKGDLALCIKDNDFDPAFGGPKRGEIREVFEVDDIQCPECGNVGLIFREWYNGPSDWYAFLSHCFIKVTPGEGDEEDRETIRAMKGETAPIVTGPRWVTEALPITLEDFKRFYFGPNWREIAP